MIVVEVFVPVQLVYAGLLLGQIEHGRARKDSSRNDGVVMQWCLELTVTVGRLPTADWTGWLPVSSCWKSNPQFLFFFIDESVRVLFFFSLSLSFFQSSKATKCIEVNG